MLKCKNCGWFGDESKLELNHIIPKYLGGTDIDGRAYLCKPCHDKWHLYLNNIIKLIWQGWCDDERWEVVKIKKE